MAAAARASDLPTKGSESIRPFRIERSAKRAYPSLLQHVRHPVGGQFAAWEQPGLLSDDLRAAFRSLR